MKKVLYDTYPHSPEEGGEQSLDQWPEYDDNRPRSHSELRFLGEAEANEKGLIIQEPMKEEMYQ